MKPLSPLLLILLITSCTAVGHKNLLYGKCAEGYLACTQFELKSDNTFYYIFMDVGGGQVIKGTWNDYNGDTIQLNTVQQPNIPQTYFKGEVNTALVGQVRVQLSDYEFPLSFAYVELNDGEAKGRLDEQGTGYFEVKEIRNITYYHIGQPVETITVEKPQVNDITIWIKDLDVEIVPRYMVNELAVATKKEITLRLHEANGPVKLKRTLFGKKWWK